MCVANMGRVKAQYNNVTGKAKYTAGTSKQQVVSNSEATDCTYCTSTQPAYIDVTFSGLTDCAGCYLSFAGGYRSVTTAVATNINGNTYRLTQTDGFFHCLWDLAVGGSYGVSKTYSDSGCTNLLRTDTYDEVFIALEFQSATTFGVSARVRIAGSPPTFPAYCFIATGTMATNDCFDIEGTLSNTVTCTEPTFRVVCSGGTAMITL